MKTKTIDIITRLNIGGASVHVVNLVHGLSAEYDTMLVCGKIEPYETEMNYYAEKYNVKINYLQYMGRELSFVRDIKGFFELYKLIKNRKPMVVHTHLSKAGTLGRMAAFCAGVPTRVHTFHGNIFKGNYSKKKIKMFILIERVLARISTHIIAISEKQKQELIDYNIAKPEKIKVIKLGFDFSNTLADESHKGLFRNQYNIPADATIISIIGRITYQKNLYLFLDIAEKLKEHNIYFPIIGDGDLRQDIQNEIDKRGLSPKVFITGFVKDLKPIYADTDIILLTSHFEGTPVTLIEAMANGKIILSTNVGGISDFVENGVSGFYFDDFIAEPFVETILMVVNNHQSSISKNARKTALETFNITRLLDDLKILLT